MHVKLITEPLTILWIRDAPGQDTLDMFVFRRHDVLNRLAPAMSPMGQIIQVWLRNYLDEYIYICIYTHVYMEIPPIYIYIYIYICKNRYAHVHVHICVFMGSM